MSGGTFNYDQHRIQNIIDNIEDVIEKNGKKIEYKPGYKRQEWQSEYHYEYPPDIIEKFKKALHILKQAYVYTQRIDWLIAGDDGEDSFCKRLKDDLLKV